MLSISHIQDCVNGEINIMAQERLPSYDEQISSGLTEQAYGYTKAKTFIHHRKQIGHKGLQEAEYSPLQRAVIMRGTKLLNIIITVFFVCCPLEGFLYKGYQ